MDDSLYFTEQHLAVRNMVREFARSEVAPVAAELDAKAEFPWANVKKRGELGLLGIPWPEELGGAGLDLLSYMIVINELAKVDASHAITISAHTTLGTSPIVNFGTAAQKKRFVPLLASGKVLGGFGLTEPGAGSDAAGTRSTAVRKGSHYILNGSKIFITHGGVGEIFIVTAVTDQLIHRDKGSKRPRQSRGTRHRARRFASGDARIPGGEEGGQAGMARVGYARAHIRGRRSAR
jgi:butyryl-CoA dehydrogenase